MQKLLFFQPCQISTPQEIFLTIRVRMYYSSLNKLKTQNNENLLFPVVVEQQFWWQVLGSSSSPTSLCVIFMVLVSLENVKKCVLGGCTITSKTKINVFWKKFFTPTAPSEPLRSEKFQKTLNLASEAQKGGASVWMTFFEVKAHYLCDVWVILMDCLLVVCNCLRSSHTNENWPFKKLDVNKT